MADTTSRIGVGYSAQIRYAATFANLPVIPSRLLYTRTVLSFPCQRAVQGPGAHMWPDDTGRWLSFL